MSTFSIEAMTSPTDICGEGPIWDFRSGTLVWTDAGSQSIFQLPRSGEHQRDVFPTNFPVSGIALNKGGGFVFSGPDGLDVWTKTAGRKIVDSYCGEKLTLNDIVADRSGRVYAGSVHWSASGMEKAGNLYLISTNGAIEVVDDGIELANGLAFSPDQKILYFTDTAARKIYGYDVDQSSGRLSNKRAVVSVPLDEGIPDGLTVDSEGFLWSAQWYGYQVVRYDPSGVVERKIRFPVPQISSVAFGGEDMQEMFVTSACEHWPSHLYPTGFDPVHPAGGALYRLKTDILGLHEFQADIAF